MSFYRFTGSPLRISLSICLSASALSLVLARPAAAQLTSVAPGTLTTNTLATIEDIAGALTGTNYDGIVTSGGLTFAERFAGQIRTTDGDFDVLSGTPSSPLTLQVGAVNQNIAVVDTDEATGNVIGGLGPLSFPDDDAIGEGSLAVLFPTNQFEFGFDIFGSGNGGDLIINAFTREGTLIQSLTISDVQLGSFAFRRTGNVADIAGISFHNNEDGGFGLDNFRYLSAASSAAPEPGSLALLALTGLTFAGAIVRRQRCRV